MRMSMSPQKGGSHSSTGAGPLREASATSAATALSSSTLLAFAIFARHCVMGLFGAAALPAVP